MKQNILIIDYGMGNLFSVEKRLNELGAKYVTSSNLKDIVTADKIIMPGVGHFGKAMENLNKFGLLDELNKVVMVDKKPILGICLGMQLMTNNSEEGNVNGLGWIDAEVKKIKVTDKNKYKVPHMGWNTINFNKKSSLIDNIENNSEFYFVHSYCVDCKYKEDILLTTKYDIEFVSAFQKNNIFGVQFHPEKSHDVGKQMFKNFINL